MAYSDFGPPRRSRRRRNVLLLIALVVIIGVLALAVGYRTERRESIDYLATAEEVAAQHAEMADRLGALLQGLGGEDRPAVAERLASLASDARESRLQLETMVVTRQVAEVGGLMMVAVAAWEDAIAALDDAIVSVLDAEEGDLSGDEALRSVFELLRLGDRAYAGVSDAVARLDPELVTVALPAVTYTGGQFAALYDSSLIAGRLRLLRGLSELRDVAITASTVPEPVSEGLAGIWVIPASDDFSLEVIVSNTGNVVAEKITITVTLQKAASSDPDARLGQLIASIDPQGSEKIVFENLEIEAGQVYTITAVASFEDGTDETDDNMWSLVFERNAE